MPSSACSANPRITPHGSLSRSQRETCVDERHVRGRRRAGAEDLAEPVDAPGAAVLAREGRRHALGTPAPSEADVPEDRAHGRLVHVLVLRREGVDRGLDHHRAHAFTAQSGTYAWRLNTQASASST